MTPGQRPACRYAHHRHIVLIGKTQRIPPNPQPRAAQRAPRPRGPLKGSAERDVGLVGSQLVFISGIRQLHSKPGPGPKNPHLHHGSGCAQAHISGADHRGARRTVGDPFEASRQLHAGVRHPPSAEPKSKTVTGCATKRRHKPRRKSGPDGGLNRTRAAVHRQRG